ncbi:MAG: hypothetical protein A2Z83_06645 [Omnitrophica bacterium GWA2_52_8]|nr:MAG: hypothetical protein A2Z83_06645 [Omnitrophica bacterium GWA2_52_8]
MGSRAERQTSLILAVVASVVLTCLIVNFLSLLRKTISPEIYLIRCAVACAAFTLPICGGWMAFRLGGGIVFAVFATVVVIFVQTIASAALFLWFPVVYSLTCFLLYQVDSYYENQTSAVAVDREKMQNKINDLSVSYKSKGQAISTQFEKYSQYYNFRRLAEKLATTISVAELSQMIVDSCLDFVPLGDFARVALAQEQQDQLAIQAVRRSIRAARTVQQHLDQAGDLFDFWVIKNRRRLIVGDTQQDFRFDAFETANVKEVRSIISTPITHEGRVIGTLRVGSSKTKVFSNDDLRLLDTISVLASSALSNAMLYEQTENLAIRDSLTGVFVRRYFFERLKDEHRRTLITKRPLSVLMCDLDHFKECNDRYGHGAGDLMLIRFAEILRENFQGGIVGRYGGEEFSVLIPEATKEEAVRRAQVICKRIREDSFEIRRERISMTVSIGVSSIPEDTLDHEQLIALADKALYQAKREGRNRVCSHTA